MVTISANAARGGRATRQHKVSKMLGFSLLFVIIGLAGVMVFA